jgi:hypothetical protein
LLERGSNVLQFRLEVGVVGNPPRRFVEAGVGFTRMPLRLQLRAIANEPFNLGDSSVGLFDMMGQPVNPRAREPAIRKARSSSRAA